MTGDRSQIASIAGLYGWANTEDRAARAAKGQEGLIESFLEKVRPEITDPAQRLKSAEALYRAHMKQLAYRSAKVRRANRDAKKAAEVTSND